MLLRSKLSRDWIHYLPFVTDALNNTPLKKIGFLKPLDIQSEADTIKVESALRSHGLKPLELPTFQEQNENQKSMKLKRKISKLTHFAILILVKISSTNPSMFLYAKTNIVSYCKSSIFL